MHIDIITELAGRNRDNIINIIVGCDDAIGFEIDNARNVVGRF